MIFLQLKTACEEFRTLVHDTTGRKLIDEVSVDEPREPEDELHFVKLVSWCYVFFFESSQKTTKYVLSLLRTRSPDEHKSVTSIFENVNNLRTVRAHNLSAGSKRDEYKKTQAHIWLIQNGAGEPTDWPSCCRSLCESVISAIHCLTDRWQQVTGNSEDAPTVVRELIAAIDREWPPYVFDGMVEDAATNIGLVGFDYVKYRESRLDGWRDLVGFFEERESAEVAISAAIQRELEQLFGRHPSQAIKPKP